MISIFLMLFVTFCRYNVNSLILHAIFLYIHAYEFPLFSIFSQILFLRPWSSYFIIKIMLISFWILQVFWKFYFKFCNSNFTLEMIPAIFFTFFQIFKLSQKSDNSNYLSRIIDVITLWLIFIFFIIIFNFLSYKFIFFIVF